MGGRHIWECGTLGHISYPPVGGNGWVADVVIL